MKNLLFILFSLLLITSVIETNAQVEKNYVVVEVGTGTWCSNCPAAARGVDDLVENGHRVAIIENHNGDSYTYSGSNARNSYYGITGYPTTVFSGVESVVGGNYSGNMYAAFLTQYEPAIQVMSDFSLDMSYTNTGLDYEIVLDITEPGDFSGTNLKVHLVLTESHIAQNWQGMSEVNFVSRAMYPDHNGTAFTGDATTLNLSFTADASWDLSKCELVAFIQDTDTKEILQSDKITLAVATNVNNVSLLEVKEIPEPCFGAIKPSFLIRNFGSDEITSLTVDYSINSGAVAGTYNWIADRPVPFYQYAEVELEDILFSLLPTNTIEINVTSVNGVADEDTSDNTHTLSFDEAPETSNQIIHLELHTDAWGDECTWTLTDYAGSILESGGPYGNNQTINEDFTLPGADCYSFNIIDSFGDGGGAITLTDDSGATLYTTSGDYGTGYSQALKTTGAGASVDDTAFANSLIYPNPANTVLNIDNAAGLNLSLYDVLGRLLITKNSILEIEQINIESIKEGTYFLKLSDGTKVRTEKILIAR